jgi:hypothetical protein
MIFLTTENMEDSQRTQSNFNYKRHSVFSVPSLRPLRLNKHFYFGLILLLLIFNSML